MQPGVAAFGRKPHFSNGKLAAFCRDVATGDTVVPVQPDKSNLSLVHRTLPGFPLTLPLSLGERERPPGISPLRRSASNHRPFVFINAVEQIMRIHMPGGGRIILPLPPGEGRGEGERACRITRLHRYTPDRVRNNPAADVVLVPAMSARLYREQLLFRAATANSRTSAL